MSRIATTLEHVLGLIKTHLRSDYSRASNISALLKRCMSSANLWETVFGKGVYLVSLMFLLASLSLYLPLSQADISTKSAGYCASYASGNIALLLLCEAELGRPPLKLTDADYNAGERAKDAKCLSTWGVGQTAPAGWKDAGCVHAGLKGVKMPDVKEVPGPSKEDNAYLMCEYIPLVKSVLEKLTEILDNEYIVYDVAQIRLRYLLRVEMK